MNHFKIEPYEYNRRLYLLIGLWPYEDSSIRRWRTWIVTLTFCGAIFLQTYALLTLEVRMQEIMDILTTYLPTICFSACYYNILFHLEHTKNIQNRINSDFDGLTNEEEWSIMKKYAFQSKVYSLITTCTCYSYIVLLFFPSFRSLYNIDVHNTTTTTVLVLPLKLEYFLKTRTRYFFMLSLQLIGAIVIDTVGIAYYTMVIACLQHACALFTLVTIKIERSLKENVDDFRSMSSTTRDKRERNEILSVIKCYNNTVDFVDFLTAISSKTYFIEMLLVLLVFFTNFLHFFQLLDMNTTRNEAIRNVIYMIGTIVIIYSAFFMGQRLIDHSIKVYVQCCQVPFYALTIKTQKLLMMLITRCLKPCSINMNGMMEASHEVFAKLTNVSYSTAIVCYRKF